MGLSIGLLKDNHIDACGSIRRLWRESALASLHRCRLEWPVPRRLLEVLTLARSHPPRQLTGNSASTASTRGGRVPLEVSGNITSQRPEYAETRHRDFGGRAHAFVARLTSDCKGLMQMHAVATRESAQDI